MTLQEFKKQYYPKKGVEECFDRKQANEYINSKSSCCWANGIVRDTGWAVLTQNQKFILVCKAELLDQK